MPGLQKSELLNATYTRAKGIPQGHDSQEVGIVGAFLGVSTIWMMTYVHNETIAMSKIKPFPSLPPPKLFSSPFVIHSSSHLLFLVHTPLFFFFFSFSVTIDGIFWNLIKWIHKMCILFWFGFSFSVIILRVIHVAYILLGSDISLNGFIIICLSVNLMMGILSCF